MFDLLKTKYRGAAMARQLKGFVGRSVRMVGHYLTEKTIKTKNNKKSGSARFCIQKEIFSIRYISQIQRPAMFR